MSFWRDVKDVFTGDYRYKQRIEKLEAELKACKERNAVLEKMFYDE